MYCLIAIIIVVILLMLYRCGRGSLNYWFTSDEEAVVPTEQAAEQAAVVATVSAAAISDAAAPIDKGLNDNVNVASERSYAVYPHPDTTACYWGSDYSQESVDAINRLNMANAEVITPMVYARTNMIPIDACRCGGSAIGMSIF